MPSKLSGSRAWALVALASQLMIGMPLAARAQDQANPPSSTAPDNSSRNKNHANTADNQKGNSSDREITQKIRQSIMADNSLSTYAHNVKIITQGGRVTLKGPVGNQNEKETIASKAAEVAGAGMVNDQLTVKQ
jgi:hyperosmotically inducible periplasmic protein